MKFTYNKAANTKTSYFITGLTLITILFTIGFYSAKSTADINLVLPIYTKHLWHNDHKHVTENFKNKAVGIEYSTENLGTGLTRIYRNSYNVKSWYAHVIRYTTQPGLKVGAGLVAVTGGYEKDLYIVPILAFKYNYVRVATTLPLGRMINLPMDVINIQLVIPLE